MKNLIPHLLSLFIVATASAQLSYPPTKTVDAEDKWFGKTYPDPYRWLEDLKNPDVAGWFKQQAGLTDATLQKIPGRQALVDQWIALDKLRPASYRDITVENGRVFFKKTLGGENVGKLYYCQGLDGQEKLLFDPTAYSKDGKTVVQSFVPSWDARHVILGLTSGGAEWSQLRVLDVDSGKLADDSIYPSYGAMGWAADNASFFYDAGTTADIKSEDIELNRQVRFHKLGTPIGQDVDLFSSACDPRLGIAPKEMPNAAIDESCPENVYGQVQTVQKELWLLAAPAADLQKGKLNWREICKRSDNIVDYVVNGEWIYGLSHDHAPMYKLVRTSLSAPDWAHAETVLPEAPDTLKSIIKTRHYLIAHYSTGLTDRLVRYEFATGKASDVILPAAGSLEIDCPDWKTDICDLLITTWTRPAKRVDYDAGKGTFTTSRFWINVPYPGLDDLEYQEVDVPSHDGTLVPLSIIYKKQIPRDGSNSCILEGYGAYGMSSEPYFSILDYSLVLRGVVVAYAHPRGGGEKGEAWYKAGYKTTKPNTWKDFIACGEYLVKKGYTSPEHLAGTGTSAGGILISRAITDRPDLFRAAVCNVGCANTLRGEFSPNGPVNIPEFGTVKDETECLALAEMDGVSHVKKGVKYPAVLGVAGWNDPRVAPWQPGKFIAALQNASTSGRPVLLKVNYDDGHFTEEKTVTFNNFAGQDAFMLWQTGHKDFQPKE